MNQPWDYRVRMAPSAVRRFWRWVFNVECQEPFCHQRRVCWLHHVETLDCPTCGHTFTEFESEFLRIFDAHMRKPTLTTWTSGTTTVKIWPYTGSNV